MLAERPALAHEVAAALNGLRLLASSADPRHRRLAWVVIQRYGLDGDSPMTIADLGRHFGITPQGARDLEHRGLDHIRRLMRRTHFYRLVHRNQLFLGISA